MAGLSTVPRPILRLLAILFAAATVLYSALWMAHIRLRPRALLGIEFEQALGDRAVRITRVVEGGGAAAAGVRPGDVVRRIEGRVPGPFEPLRSTVVLGRPGDVVRLTIERPGLDGPVVLPVVLGPPRPAEETPAQSLTEQVVMAFPIVFLVVGLVVLFLRLHDRNAWLLALLFAGLIAVAPMVPLEDLLPASLRGFAMAYKVTFHGMCGAFLYAFCAVFPAASPLDRRLPWLKRFWLAAGAGVAVPLGIAALWSNGSRPILQFADWVGRGTVTAALSIYFFGTAILALASLVWNRLRAPTPEARRKTRVIVWGMVAGVTPFLLLEAASVATRKDPYDFPFWVWAPCVLAILLLPLSFAYAVVKHRVLEIPILLKRGARYMLVQRGFTLLLVAAGAALTLMFAAWTSDLFRTRMDLAAGAGTTLGVGFGVVLVWAGVRLRTQVTQRIDRAFFRNAYDARQILQALAERMVTATSREELGAFLAQRLQQALHPRSLAIYLELPDGSLEAVGAAPAGAERIPASHPALAAIARLGRPVEILPGPPLGPGDPSLEEMLPGPLREPGCVVPLVGRAGRLAGVILLGERLSEEPYSGEDRRLLSTVARQAALALENLRLAGQIAERLEAERRVALELELAKEVQSRLLPSRVPRLRTLECAGDCVQARAVGGDYYDFLELGEGEIGLVLADIAGKGIAGSLMMATLQASLRSQSALARHDLKRLVVRLNLSLCESVAAGRYATLFFGCYEDRTRRLRYVNCGHNPPILLRADDRADRLAATATILGAFETWDGALAERVLEPGDILLLYTDGITETTSDRGEEFGEARLLETLRRHRHLEAPGLVAAILRAVRDFSGSEPGDDITIVAARCVA